MRNPFQYRRAVGYAILTTGMATALYLNAEQATRISKVEEVTHQVERVITPVIHNNKLVILGKQGQQGKQGLRGPRGERGSQGATGRQGVQGPAGRSIQGPRGAQGVQGVQGPPGVRGPNGANGSGNSANGIPQGPTSKRGPSKKLKEIGKLK